MFLKYFYDTKLAHASYIVGCQVTGEALVVDPGRDVAQYLDAAEQAGLRLAAVTETHIHADFVSGARELADRTGATLCLSDEGDENWKYTYLDGYSHHLLKDGDSFMVGNVRLEALHTPGHTPEHLSFLLINTAGADQPMGIFSGDFVFVGSVGRPDLLEKAAGFTDTAVDGARQLFHSLKRFTALPDYLQVWPAHGAGSACGKGLGAVPSTTVGYEKLFNPALSYQDEDEFVHMLLEGQPEPPKYFAVMKRVNKEGPPLLDTLAAPAHLPAGRLRKLLDTGAFVVDTRASDAFAAAHLPGAINIPLSRLSTWAGWLIDYEWPFYLIIDEAEVMTAVRDLAYIGLDNVAGYFEASAVDRWIGPLESYQAVTPGEIAAQVLNGEVTVVDVRAETEFAAGRLPGAVHVMLGYLPDHAEELINSKPILVQCRTGARSAIGASILRARGARQVFNLAGGIRDWAAAGLPVKK